MNLFDRPSDGCAGLGDLLGAVVDGVDVAVDLAQRAGDLGKADSRCVDDFAASGDLAPALADGAACTKSEQCRSDRCLNGMCESSSA